MKNCAMIKGRVNKSNRENGGTNMAILVAGGAGYIGVPYMCRIVKRRI